MPAKLSQTAFCALVVESGLIPADRLQHIREQFEREHRTRNPEHCQEFAEFLVKTRELTLWQAQKLVQGKHKGFVMGKYRLLSVLGSGGMSTVYLAEHTSLRRKCAIKILPLKRVADEAALSRFYREAQAVAALDHPNIVRAYDVDHLKEGNADVHFLVMEYVEGRSLQQVVDEDGPLSVLKAVDYMRQAANGLAHAHSIGLVHRDVKPGNLLLDQSGTVKVLDLGLARMFEDAGEESSLTIEYHQTVLGTADYLSPEQAVDSHTVDARADLYSLGCTLYFLLTGRPPFNEGTIAQRLLAHQNREPAPVTESRSDIPASLVALMNRLMAKMPDERFESAQEVHKVLTKWLQDHARRPQRSSPPGSSPAESRSKPQPHPEAKRKSPSGSNSSTARPSPSDSGNRTKKRPQQAARRDGEADGSLAAFLNQLNDGGPHDTIDPSFSSSDTIVSAGNPAGRQHAVAVKDSAASSSAVSAAAPSRPQRAQTEVQTQPPPDAPAATVPTRHHALLQKKGRSIGIAGLLIVAVALSAYFIVDSETPNPRADTQDTVPANAAHDESAAAMQHIDPNEDLLVGPEGHFASIGAALNYVQETFHPLAPTDVRTIRVAGGHTYPERIAIDNSTARSFPQGIRLVCEDAERAILEPTGDDPVIDLRTAERFHISGFTIRGTGQPSLIHLEGYLINTRLLDLTIEGAGDAAVVGEGVTGFSGEGRCLLQNLTFRSAPASRIAMQFRPGSTGTKNLATRGCRILPGFETGLRLSGGFAEIEVAECIVDSAATGLLFDASPEPVSDVTITNCTFRECERAIVLVRSLTPSDGSFVVTKSLFAGANTSAMLIAGETPATQDMTQIRASFNWTQQPALPDPAAGEVDIFSSNGRQGAEISFASVNPDDGPTYLQPQGSDLRKAADELANPPKYIGAVPLAP